MTRTSLFLMGFLFVLCSHTRSVYAQNCLNARTELFDQQVNARVAVEDLIAVRDPFVEGQMRTRRLRDRSSKPKEIPSARYYVGAHWDVAILQERNDCEDPNAGLKGSWHLISNRLGGAVGVELPRLDLSLQYFLAYYLLDLEQEIMSSRENTESDAVLLSSLNQVTHAVRMQFTQWAALSFGISILNRDDNQTNQYFLLGEVPKLKTSINLLLIDGEAETFRFQTKGIRFGSLPLETSLEAAYLDVEERVYGVVGLGWLILDDTLRVEELNSSGSRELIERGYRLKLVGEAAPEFASTGLRFARARLSFGGLGDVAVKESDTSQTGTFSVTDNFYVEGSFYNGQFMRKRTGREGVFGYNIGAEVRMDTQDYGIVAGLRFGMNRPETLSLLPVAVGLIDMNMKLAFQLKI